MELSKRFDLSLFCFAFKNFFEDRSLLFRTWIKLFTFNVVMSKLDCIGWIKNVY